MEDDVTQLKDRIAELEEELATKESEIKTLRDAVEECFGQAKHALREIGAMR